MFRLASDIASRPRALVAGALLVWAAAETAAVYSGVANMPVLGSSFSYARHRRRHALSVVLTGTASGRVLGYCGLHSIAIYLAFTLFMGPVRVVALKFTDR